MPEVLHLKHGLEIPLDEITVEYARAGGPGGQHVNKTETKVTLRLSVETSSAFEDTQRAWLRERLAPRLTRSGELLVSVDAHRERQRNLGEAYTRLAEILDRALERPKPRKKTAPSLGAKRRRLQEKKAIGEKKRQRKPPRGDD